jgi:hypothetical protein
VDDHGRGESLVSDLRQRAAAVARVRKSSLRLGIGKIKKKSYSFMLSDIVSNLSDLPVPARYFFCAYRYLFYS